MFKTISLKIDKRGVGTLKLNRPEKHNALSSTMINELAEVTEIINNENALRVVVLRGAVVKLRQIEVLVLLCVVRVASHGSWVLQAELYAVVAVIGMLLSRSG